MRLSATHTSFGLLSVLFLCSNGKPIHRTIPCTGDNCNENQAIDWGTVSSIEAPFPGILPRAGGGGGRTEKGPDGGVAHPGDNNKAPNGGGDQNGDEGGFTNTCQKRRDWLTFERRAGCASNATPANPPPAPQGPQQNQYEPSPRNNYNQPATQGERIDPAAKRVPVIDVN
ncbi:hypothetical protein BCR34DRAFT_602225 [Clohesyomyces aquaticus]|uniref:Uncharacterized protein n=1 Tax=Clohesyomyces aquaticus TaxID=1231657 RepID=A0A1Y1ZK96_9PLEO|nr:hypothetical protein BCR34DRAFT_602225 [Clohesyomyces aquaticus]